MRSSLSRSFERNPVRSSKILCSIFVICFYLIYVNFNEPPALTKGQPLPKRPTIQFDQWVNNTGKADDDRKKRIKEAMEHTFRGYRNKAWGKDDIKPVDGGFVNSRNGWAAFIVDSSTTLAVMGMKDELLKELEFIKSIDFGKHERMVDPFETTIRYLGGLVSLVELSDGGVISSKVMSQSMRKVILEQAENLGENLLLAYHGRTGLPWNRVEFETGQVYGEKAGLARIGSNFLENCVLTKLTGRPEFCATAALAWAPLVRNKYIETFPGLVDGPLNVETGEPMGREAHWDRGHDSYYEYLLKAHLLQPDSPNSKLYLKRWIQAAEAIRHYLSSRSSPTTGHAPSHLYLGRRNGPWYENEMTHLACFVPGNLLLGGRHTQRRDLVTLGKALLEGCANSYRSSPTGLGPESFSWVIGQADRNGTYEPRSRRQEAELERYGFWVADPKYKLRPEYVESLFYAYRITGEARYREWAWDAFEALEKYCKTRFGYAGLEDVMVTRAEDVKWIDHSESYWSAETLKYLYLIFEDVNVISLDEWIFTTEGHLLRKAT